MSGRGDREVVEELASVSREIARLLTQPRYDEAELAELDVRAKALRAQVQEAAERRRQLLAWSEGRFSGPTSGG